MLSKKNKDEVSFSEEIAGGLSFDDRDTTPLTDEAMTAAGVIDENELSDKAEVLISDDRPASEKTWGEILEKSADEAVNRYLRPAAKKVKRGYMLYGIVMSILALLMSPQTTVTDKIWIFGLAMAIFLTVNLVDSGITKLVNKIRAEKAVAA